MIAVTKYSNVDGDQGFSLWDLKTEREVFTTSESVYAISFSPNRQYLAAGMRANKLKLWDVSDPLN
jgi:WD40 repeat protein